MSSESSNGSNGRPQGSMMPLVYDATCLMPTHGGEARTARFDWQGRGVEGAVPIGPGPVTPPQPRWTHTFEFRLTGSEAQEQCVPLPPEFPPAEFIVVTPAVRTYLTRTHDPAAVSSAIGGVEVQAELRGSAIVCRAGLTDFGPGDLVVVQVDVARERKTGRSS